MIFFPLVINFFLISTSFSKEYDNTTIYQFNNNEIDTKKIIKAFAEFIIDKLKKNLTYTESVVRDPDKINQFIEFLKFFLEEKDEKVIIPLVEDLLYNKSNIIINDTFDIIKEYPEILNYSSNIVNLIDNFTYDGLFYNLSKILNISRVHDLLKYSYNRYKIIFPSLMRIFLEDLPFYKMLTMVKDFIFKYLDLLVEFCYDLIVNYGKFRNMVYIIKDFITGPNSTSIIEDLKIILTNITITQEISDMIYLDDKIADKIFEEIITNTELMDILVESLKNKDFVGNISYFFANMDDDPNIYDIIPKYIATLNKTYVELIMNFFQTITKRLLTAEKVNRLIAQKVANELKNYMFSHTFKHFNLSENCIFLINYTFFSYYTKNIENFRLYYLKKLGLDSTKNKNDFLTYENCLDNNFTSEYSEKYKIKQVFIVSMINDKFNKSKLKNNLLFQKYNYLFGSCLPYGTIKSPDNNTETPMCSENDYNIISKILLSVSFNMNTSNAESYIFSYERLDITLEDYLYLLLFIIIFLIPFLIRIFLIISKKIISGYQIKTQKINKLILDENEKNSIRKQEIIINDNENEKKRIRFVVPKWYKLLSDSFNVRKNMKELFNNEVNENNLNNYNGITYIKGILSISMILNIIGLTFYILSNLPTKIISTTEFYETIKNPLYSLIFIGLRYSPRVIFSCSGYTLSYKFLNFIENEQSYYLIKFIIIQSYKYILLIFITFFFGFSIYYLGFLFRELKSPVIEFNKERFKNMNIFGDFITFLFDDIMNFENVKSNSYYIYMSLNEIFFFIFGTLIISIGYKFKFRIDYLIIAIILLIYFGKIFLYLFYFHKEQIYSTLYFFLYGYGAFMLNPLFNLPSFLIGMYFGIVNYSIQRGVNSLYEKNQYSKINALEMKNTELLKDENSIKSFNDVNSETYESDSSIYISDSNKDTSQDNLFGENSKESVIYNEKITEMPFLISAVNFSNFIRKRHGKFYFNILIIVLIFIIIFFITLKYIYIYFYIDRYLKPNGNDIVKLSLNDIIPNLGLNIIYVIDIEIVVFIINLICFILYFKGGQLNDFLNNIHWSFFIKSYFSHITVSSQIILYIFYHSETVITVGLFNIYLYSLISIIFIGLNTIICYILFELPLKKLFKECKFRKSNLDYDEHNIDEDEDGIEIDIDEKSDLIA